MVLEERADEENYPIRLSPSPSPSPSLPYPTFSLELVRSVCFILKSHLLIAACFNLNRIYNTILDHDWFSARLFVT